MTRISRPIKRKPIPASATHLHKCGDYDACYLSRHDALLVDCRSCTREQFRERVKNES